MRIVAKYSWKISWEEIIDGKMFKRSWHYYTKKHAQDFYDQLLTDNACHNVRIEHV